MEKPNTNYRYLITEDNGKTVRLMRFLGSNGNNPDVTNGLYTFKMGKAKPYADKVQLDTMGYLAFMSVEIWEQDLFQHTFKILKVFETEAYRIMIDPPNPTVYFMSDNIEYED